MSRKPETKDLVSTSYQKAIRLFGSFWLCFLPFVFASGMLGAVFGMTRPDLSTYIVMTILTFAVLYTGCLSSAHMYRVLLGKKSGTIYKDSLNLYIANILFYIAVFIIIFVLFLFFLLFSEILTGVMRNDLARPVTGPVFDSLEPVRESGAYWLLILLLTGACTGFVWFCLRMIAFGPATIAQGRICVFRAWAISRGLCLVLIPAGIMLQIIPFMLCTGMVVTVVAGMDVIPDLLCSYGNLFCHDTETDTPRMFSGFHAGSGLYVLLFAPFWWFGHALAATVYTMAERDGSDATSPAMTKVSKLQM